MIVARRPWIALPVLSAFLFGVASPSSAATSDGKRAEAAQIAKRRESLIQRGERVNEQSKATKRSIEQVSDEIGATQSAVTAGSETVAAINRDVVKVVINSYVYGQQGPVAGLVRSFDGSGPSLEAAREGYASLIVGSAADSVDEVRAARQDAERLEQRLTTQQAKLSTLNTQLENETVVIEKIQADLTALASKVNGELVQLVADEARQREEAEAARARADADRQRKELARLAELQRQEALRVAEQQTRALAAKRATEIAQAAAAKAKATRTARATPAALAALPTADASRPTATQQIVDTVPRPPAPNPGAATAIAEALRQLGKPYVFGTNGPDTFDCSGLTQWAWAKAGVSMDHYTGSQANQFPRVAFGELQPGDLVFFNVDLGHMGMYIGNDQIVQAPRTGDVVKISSLNRNNIVVAVRPG